MKPAPDHPGMVDRYLAREVELGRESGCPGSGGSACISGEPLQDHSQEPTGDVIESRESFISTRCSSVQPSHAVRPQ